MGQQNNGSSLDQYRRLEGNFFNPISKHIAMNAQNSSNSNGVQSNLPLVVLDFSSITSEVYRLVSRTILHCTLWDQNFSNNPGKDGMRPYGCVHPGSGLVKGNGGFL
jgi:hypothetical protein